MRHGLRILIILPLAKIAVSTDVSSLLNYLRRRLVLFGKEELEVRRQLGGGVARACHPRVQKKKKILYRKNSVILLNVGIILDVNWVCK